MNTIVLIYLLLRVVVSNAGNRSGLIVTIYRVNIKKYPPTTFVDISAMRGDFCMKFYRTVKQSNIHFITKFG